MASGQETGEETKIQCCCCICVNDTCDETCICENDKCKMRLSKILKEQSSIKEGEEIKDVKECICICTCNDQTSCVCKISCCGIDKQLDCKCTVTCKCANGEQACKTTDGKECNRASKDEDKNCTCKLLCCKLNNDVSCKNRCQPCMIVCDCNCAKNDDNTNHGCICTLKLDCQTAICCKWKISSTD